MLTSNPFAAPISEQIWDMKYRMKEADGTPVDATVEATWSRIANALAAPENDPHHWSPKFYEAMADFKFIPAGRIVAGAGTDRNVTLFNCLSGDTKILTDQGMVEISEVVGQRVKVLDGNGHWIESPINSFGEQPVAPVVLKGGYNGRERRIVRATKDHRWILDGETETTTEKLVPGDRLKKVIRQDTARNLDYNLGVVHGMVYGDGTFGYAKKDEMPVYKVRLCGPKKELSYLFEEIHKVFCVSFSSPPSFEGDTLAQVEGWTDLKALPKNPTVEYLTGFLRGWLATDGCVDTRDGRVLLTCGVEEAEWVERYGPIAGMELNYKSALSQETNFGDRKKRLYNVVFTKWTMIPEDFLREHHKENFGENSGYHWEVLEVGEYGEPEPVFCPRVLTTDSVQLHSGIHTGQCYVMGTIPDSMAGIFDMLKEAALTMQQGGGIGYDFSTIRPKGSLVKGVAADASGPLTFMDCWDAMCRTVMSAGSRRGAMMATMRCDHPDIEDFITAKADSTRLRMFNLSVLVTDDFMTAVKNDEMWFLSHAEPPAQPVVGGDPQKHDGSAELRGENLFIHKVIRARDLWNKIMESTYAQAEPGVIFIDRINADNNLNYCETISATNPCGEQPLPPYGACLLGSINLARLVHKPFQKNAGIDSMSLHDIVTVAVRMMDNVNDVSNFPLESQRAEAQRKRRIGLGVTGLADALAMCGLTYGTEEAAERTAKWMKLIDEAAYWASVNLAKEKGAFPAFDADKYLAEGTHASKHPVDLQMAIREHGIRNSHLTSIAPTGTISLYAGNVSSGIEPIFAFDYERKVLLPDGTHMTETVEDFAVAVYRTEWLASNNPAIEQHEPFDPVDHLPDQFVTAQTLTPADHVRMQAAAQRHVDSSISKTINCPEDISFEDFKEVYMMAWDTGCKGCTTYRPNEVTGSILSVKKDEPETTPLTDEALREAAYSFLGTGEKKERMAELSEMLGAYGVSKVSELFGPERINDAHALHDWLTRRQEDLWFSAKIAVPVEDVSEESAAAQDETPQARPDVLNGKTYKIKLGDSHAVYVNITDIVEGGHRRPFEVFINTKDPSHVAWTTALTRMISAIFRRPHDSSFVVEELKAVFDPAGGGWWQGAYHHSIVAAIGKVIGDHMDSIGYGRNGGVATGSGIRDDEVAVVLSEPPGKTDRYGNPGCQKCFSTNVKVENGCPTCLDCGHSKCG